MIDKDPRVVVEETLASLQDLLRLFEVLPNIEETRKGLRGIIGYLEIMHGKMLTETPLEAEGRCDCGGNLSPYDPEGAPGGTYPGNYKCDGCDKISQRHSETRAGVPIEVNWEPMTESAGVPAIVSDESTKPNIVARWPDGAGVFCPECGEECRLWLAERIPACARLQCDRWGKALDDGRDLV